MPHLRIEARHNFGPAVIAKPLNDLAQFLDDDFSLFLGAFQNGREFFDLALQFLGLIQDFLALQRGQSAQLQVQNRRGLLVVNRQKSNQPSFRILHRGGLANQVNHRIKRIKGEKIALQDVPISLRLREPERCPADNDLDLVV